MQTLLLLTLKVAGQVFAQLIAGNSASDYNGGNNGTISDESFNNLIATVESYLSKEKNA